MNIQLQTELCDRFGIRYPLILAGMAGGPTTVELVAAVSNAGGLGTLGAAYMEPAAIRDSIQEIRKRTDQPFAVNLFASRASDRQERIEDVQQELNRMRGDLGIPHAGSDHVTTPDWFEQQFAVLLEEKVPVISTAFGIPDGPLMRQAKEAKLLVVAMATTVREAILAEQAGCDAVVAQGSEAGDIEAHLIFRITRWGPKSEHLLWCRRSWTGSRSPSLPPGASWMDADSWPRLFLAPKPFRWVRGF